MDNAIRQDIQLSDFSAGILRGIVAVTEDRRDLRGWRLYDRRAHAAAAEVFRRLHKFHRSEYDLRFRLYLDYMGYSPVWARAVSDELYLYRTLTQWLPEGVFDILPEMNDLDRWLRRDGAAGTVDLWKACAQRFIDEYTNFTE